MTEVVLLLILAGAYFIAMQLDKLLGFLIGYIKLRRKIKREAIESIQGLYSRGLNFIQVQKVIDESSLGSSRKIWIKAGETVKKKRRKKRCINS